LINIADGTTWDDEMEAPRKEFLDKARRENQQDFFLDNIIKDPSTATRNNLCPNIQVASSLNVLERHLK
jgi:hypothetical protein